MRPIRPDDDIMILAEKDTCPFHIGAYQRYQVPAAERPGFLARVREHFAKRLPATPLLCRLVEHPDGFDSSQWLELASCDLDYHITAVDPAETRTWPAVDDFIGRCTLERLDLSRPPFRVYVMSELPDPDQCALLIKVHHAVADGIGFQTIVTLLTDPTPKPSYGQPKRTLDETPPTAAEWTAAAEARFAAEAPLREQQAATRKAAEEALAALRTDPAMKRAKTPQLKLGNQITTARTYSTLSLPLARFRALGKALGATVNDIFLTVCGGALRSYLLALDDLPEEPLVVNSARSLRQPEHGDFGNRIVALNPHIGTHLSNPLDRLRAIQQAMAVELKRSDIVKLTLDRMETPYGASKRKQGFAKYADTTGRAMPGNITVANVPGPAEPRYLAGYRQLTNFPTPILEGGRFLNITLRRNADMLDAGIMVNSRHPVEDRRLGEYLEAALGELEQAAAGLQKQFQQQSQQQ